MAKRTYVHGECFGSVFRFSQTKWRLMLKEVAAGRDVDYAKYGVEVAVIDHHITDLWQEDAVELLKDSTMRLTKKQRRGE